VCTPFTPWTDYRSFFIYSGFFVRVGEEVERRTGGKVPCCGLTPGTSQQLKSNKEIFKQPEIGY
jgi:hypothetical protein